MNVTIPYFTQKSILNLYRDSLRSFSRKEGMLHSMFHFECPKAIPWQSHCPEVALKLDMEYKQSAVSTGVF